MQLDELTLLSSLAAIILLPQLPLQYETTDGRLKSTDAFLIDYVSHYLSLLILVPDNPNQQPLYIFNGLLHVVRGELSEIRSSHSNPDAIFYIYLSMLQYLSVADQDTYPYHLDQGKSFIIAFLSDGGSRSLPLFLYFKPNLVEANDTLYGGNENFMSAIRSARNEVIGEIVGILKRLGDEKVGPHMNTIIHQVIKTILILSGCYRYTRNRRTWP